VEATQQPAHHARIYAEWHRAASTKDGAALIALYAEDAVLESPLVPALLDDKADGVLRGRDEIRRFLEAGARSRPIDLVRWHRSDRFFSSGSTLVWEYPRETPEGDQVEIVEVMDIVDSLIKHHRIYWGWKGCTLLAPSLKRVAVPPRNR
jgi:steroid delta-isomerase